MYSRELVQRALEFDSPPGIPRQLWLLPWAEDNYPGEVDRLSREYPDDIVSAPTLYNSPVPTEGDRYRMGTYVDEWGCRFDNLHEGVIGIVKEPLIRNWKELEDFRTPEKVLDLDTGGIDSFCRSSDRFVLSGTLVRPFERLCFIRSMEQALIDLGEQLPELFELLGRIHNHYIREVEIWAETDVNAIALMDDWGTQHGLMVSPDLWRDLFKPMYRDYIEIAHRRGKYVFMHSDGYITDIIPDLIEVGIDALNSQIYCMGVDELGKRFRGKITFWGEIDRQHILPHGTLEDVREAVAEVWESFNEDGGGVIAQCEFGPGAVPENVFEVFRTWDTISRSSTRSSGGGP